MLQEETKVHILVCPCVTASYMQQTFLMKAMDTLKNVGTHPDIINCLEDKFQALLAIPQCKKSIEKVPTLNPQYPAIQAVCEETRLKKKYTAPEGMD
jgi:hypothetical protein